MAKSLSHQAVVLPLIAAALRKASQAAVLLPGLALVMVPPPVVFGQSNQQQEQQQREQQEREQQQREQHVREQQQRDQQQRDQQQREQQDRVQQQLHSSSDSPAPISNVTLDPSRPTAQPPAATVKSTTSAIQPIGTERKVNSASAVDTTATKDHASSPADPDLRRGICEDGPCKEPAPKPVQLKPIAPDPPRKACKDGPCQPCPAGQSESKDDFCAPPPGVVKNGNVLGVGSAKNAAQQPCAAGQVWDGTQCLIVGAQQCLPGQSRVGTSCQADCTIATTSAQGVIERLRSARQSRDDVCRKIPAGQECQMADADYSLMLNEYRNFLGGVPAECRATLPDPIAI